MNIKIVATANGQQLIAGVKALENSETNQLVAYWLQQPRLLAYNRGENGETVLNLLPFCLASDVNEFSISEHHVIAILEPRADVVEGYRAQVFPSTEQLTASSNEGETAAAAPQEETTEAVAQEETTEAADQEG